MTGRVLFLDLATTTGWCEGEPGKSPESGTIRLAPAGASPAAAFGGLIAFLGERLTARRYRLVAYEQPMDPRHLKTNINTARKLIGMPAIVEGLCHQTGHSRVHEVGVHAIRKSLIGGRPARGEAKREVTKHLHLLGYRPADDNEADAIAGWLHVTAIIDPESGARGGPLFAARRV